MGTVVGVYRPRHPERTTFYQLVDQFFPRYVEVYDERFEPRCGSLRPVVPRTVAAFLDCGCLKNGFARLRCGSCGGEHLLAFSCSTRNFCPSCQAKRSALFAERLAEEVLAAVPHRHVVLTMPKALRGLFERDRNLLGLLSRAGYDVVREALAESAGEAVGVPGVISSIQTFSAYTRFHPHLHLLVAEGLFTPDGGFQAVAWCDEDRLEERFRRRVLSALEEAERLSPETRERLLAWEHSGFSVYGRQVLAPDDPAQIAHLLRYLTRAPWRTDGARLDAEGRVRVLTPPDPTSGQTVLVLDPLEWMHAVVTQIPDSGLHLTRSYGAYSNRLRKQWAHLRASPGASDGSQSSSCATGESEGPSADPPESEFVKKRKASWARLLRKILEVDPFACPRCGETMKIVAVITEPGVIDRILRHVAEHGGSDVHEQRGPPQDRAAVPAAATDEIEVRSDGHRSTGSMAETEG